MGAGLFDRFPDLTAQADEILGYSIAALCATDDDSKLTQTQFTQPALFVVNALTARAQAEDRGETPDFVAGHSVGEYNALEYADVISFEDGLRLVQKRGALMSTAPKGTMAAIVGLTSSRVAAVLQKAGLDSIDLANFNSDTQTIIAGQPDDLEKAQPVFEKNQAMYIPLNVSGAFHSRYMAPVQDEFAEFLNGFQFNQGRMPVIANVDALPYQPDQAASVLARQLTSTVKWHDSIVYLLDAGVTDFFEAGPGDVLSKLSKAIQKCHVPDTSRKVQRPVDVLPSKDPKAAIPSDAASNDPHHVVATWNARHQVGTAVQVKGYDDKLILKSPALVLFGHRAAVYMEGYNGYFALDDVVSTA